MMPAPGGLAPAKPFDDGVQIIPPAIENIPGGTFNPAVPHVGPNKPYTKETDTAPGPIKPKFN